MKKIDIKKAVYYLQIIYANNILQHNPNEFFVMYNTLQWQNYNIFKIKIMFFNKCMHVTLAEDKTDLNK